MKTRAKALGFALLVALCLSVAQRADSFVGRATKFTATGALGLGNIECFLILTPGSTAALADIKEGGTGGTVVLSLSAAANGPSVQVGPITIADPFLSAISGTGASLSIVK
jgi:hypothetical protein